MRKYSEEDIILSHKGRIISDRKGLKGGHCGSAPLELHRKQLNDPDSWVHSSVDSWIEETMPSKDEQIEQLQAENERYKEAIQRALALMENWYAEPITQAEKFLHQALKGGE